MKTEHQEAIGKKLAAFRKAKGMSQKELAKDICAPSSISQMESGIFVLSAGILQQLCDRLEVKMDDLIEGYLSVLEIPALLDMIKVQIEREDYQGALRVIEELEANNGRLDDEEKQKLILYKSECFVRTGKAGQAIIYLEDLQKSLEQQRNADDHLLAELYNQLGNAQFFASHIVNAFACYWRAFNISLRFPVVNELAAKITFNMGKVCSTMGNTKQAYEYFGMAEKYFVGASDTKRIALVLFEQGLVYIELKDWEKAQSSLNESFALYKSLSMWKMVQRVREEIAYEFLSKQHPSVAVRELDECAKELERLQEYSHSACSYARASRILIDNDQLLEAEQYLNAASKMHPETLTPILAYIHQTKAKYLLRTKKYEEAIEFSSKASDLFAKMGLGRESAEALRLSAESYREQGNLQKALDVSDRAFDILQSSYFGKFQS